VVNHSLIVGLSPLPLLNFQCINSYAPCIFYLERVINMKGFAFHFAVALITFILGVTTVSLLLYQSDYSSLNKKGVSAQSQPASQPQSTPKAFPADESDPLEACYIKGDKLSYAGYDVEKSFDAVTNESSATIRKNGKIITTLSNGGFSKDSTEIGLFPFLGGGTKQLVVMQYTGGAHCCWVYKIYDFSPQLRLIFDGEDYNIGYELHPEDLDSDGTQEFTQAVMTFDYFHMSHASSVFPTAVFSYNEKRRRYLPVNHKFSSYLLKGMEKDLERVGEERARIAANNVIANERYLSAVMQVTLKYIYAGRRAEGWEFYNLEYNLNDKDEIKADIKKALKGDPIYQSIYRGGAP
jgi:hypothetical protein